MKISKSLNIPKETTRRKINELEKSGAIKRIKRRTIIDKSMFPFMKPQKSIIRMSRFLSTISNILYRRKYLTTNLNQLKLKIL